MVLDDRSLTDAIDAEVDGVGCAPRLDLDPAALPVQHERHGEDRLERVALRATGRADICFARRDPHAEVKDVLDYIGREARAVVLYR